MSSKPAAKAHAAADHANEAAHHAEVAAVEATTPTTWTPSKIIGTAIGGLFALIVLLMLGLGTIGACVYAWNSGMLNPKPVAQTPPVQTTQPAPQQVVGPTTVVPPTYYANTPPVYYASNPPAVMQTQVNVPGPGLVQVDSAPPPFAKPGMVKVIPSR